MRPHGSGTVFTHDEIFNQITLSMQFTKSLKVSLNFRSLKRHKPVPRNRYVIVPIGERDEPRRECRFFMLHKSKRPSRGTTFQTLWTFPTRHTYRPVVLLSPNFKWSYTHIIRVEDYQIQASFEPQTPDLTPEQIGYPIHYR